MKRDWDFSNAVREFHEALRAKNADVLIDVDLYSTGPIKDEALRRSCNIIREEMYELIEALHSGSKADVLKESCDLIYVTVAALTTFGLDHNLMPAFNRVQANNMLKVETGSLIDGKWTKPKDHPKTHLDDLVQTMQGAA